MKTSVEIRNDRVDILELDLVGPRPGSTNENEVLPQADSQYTRPGHFGTPALEGQEGRTEMRGLAAVQGGKTRGGVYGTARHRGVHAEGRQRAAASIRRTAIPRFKRCGRSSGTSVITRRSPSLRRQIKCSPSLMPSKCDDSPALLLIEKNVLGVFFVLADVFDDIGVG